MAEFEGPENILGMLAQSENFEFRRWDIILEKFYRCRWVVFPSFLSSDICLLLSDLLDIPEPEIFNLVKVGLYFLGAGYDFPVAGQQQFNIQLGHAFDAFFDDAPIAAG